jgi:hypothetical protein
VIPKLILTLAGLLLTLPAASQQAPEPSSNQPQVKVNLLNVCTPSAEEQKEIAAALARIPKQPLFAPDFEISHGLSTLTDAPNFLQPGSAHTSDEPSVARYVRIRHEFSVQALFASVQYSFSNDGQNMVETLVLHAREPKDLIQVSMEDSASAISSAENMVAANTPASRIRLERFGKSSIALARCMGSENGPPPDQSAYETVIPQRLRSAGQLSRTARRAAHRARRAGPDPRGTKAAAKPKSAKPAEEKK